MTRILAFRGSRVLDNCHPRVLVIRGKEKKERLNSRPSLRPDSRLTDNRIRPSLSPWRGKERIAKRDDASSSSRSRIFTRNFSLALDESIGRNGINFLEAIFFPPLPPRPRRVRLRERRNAAGIASVTRSIMHRFRNRKRSYRGIDWRRKY